MCGLSVVVKLSGTSSSGKSDSREVTISDLKSKLIASLKLIDHRGPDARDVWINAENTVGLGHCRLSIVDLSPEGEQPLHDDEGHIHAVVMGEIYDNDRLRKLCSKEFEYKFRGHSDSELVVALYKHYGAPKFLDYLRGEYAFVIYDDRSGEVIAARDRFGVKPLFWTIVDGKLLMAPEIKAFLPLGWQPAWNIDGIVQNSCFVGSETIFQGVNRLQPGHYLTVFSNGYISEREYWDLKYQDKRHVETRSIDELVAEVREQIIEAVRVRLRADVPVGIYLSGGLDSSTVAGITKYLVEERGEKRTADYLGVDFHVKDMNEAELAKHFEDCVWHNEHHAFDLGTVGKFALSELPRSNGFKVILSGEGADELFAGYPWFISEFLLEPDRSSPNLVLQTDDVLRQKLYQRSINDILATFNIIGSSNLNCLDIDPELKARMNNLFAPFNFANRAHTGQDLFLPSLQDRFSPMDKLRAVIDAWSPSAQEDIMNRWHPLNSAMYAWSKSQLPNFILTALGDRCEMAHSIEGRPPFLDHNLAELMGTIPPSLKMHYGSKGKGPDSGTSAWWSKDGDQAASHFWEKWILREAARPFITEELYLRRKHPYTAPVVWPKGGPLHQLFTRLLTEENVDALGFVHWPTVEDSLEKGFGENADPGALRKCLIVGGWVTMKERFGIPRAQVGKGAML
ncbi:hypothetical protein JX266_005739 [Neoarthrinium moseri]|nr:hypothetical protein JX266_005739 [Neoarthrinium moseri]